MEVQLTFAKGGGKRFQIVFSNADGIARRSLGNLLKNEAQASKEGNEASAIDRSNYRFTLLGLEKCLGWNCYKLQLRPRRKSKFLIDGMAWVSTDDNMVVRTVGRLAKSPSFWLKRPEVEQQSEKIQGFWLPS